MGRAAGIAGEVREFCGERPSLKEEGTRAEGLRGPDGGGEGAELGEGVRLIFE